MNAIRAPRGAVRAIRAGARTILAVALIGALAGLAWGLGGETTYESVASVVLADREDAEELADVGGEVIDPGADDAVPRLVEIAGSREVARAAAAGLGGDVGGADLLARVTPRPGEGRTIELVARAESPDYAAAAADAYAEALAEVVGRDERRRLRAVEEQLAEELAELAPQVGAAPIDPVTGEPLEAEGTVEEAAELAQRIAALQRLRRATEPLIVARSAELTEEPVESRSALLWMLIGLLAGTALGLVLAGGRELVRRPVRDPASFAAAAGAEHGMVIAAAEPLVRVPAPGRIRIDDAAGDDPFAIVERLGLAAGDGGESIAVTAAEAGRTAASVALALAVAAAEEGADVICVESDLERPLIASDLGLEPSPGLAEYLAREATPREVMRPLSAGPGSDSGALVCVPAGVADGAPLELLESPRFGSLVDRVTRVYDLALFVAPSLLGGGEGAAVVRRTDEVILCARRGGSSGRDLASARGRLAGAAPLAAVLVGPEGEGMAS